MVRPVRSADEIERARQQSDEWERSLKRERKRFDGDESKRKQRDRVRHQQSNLRHPVRVEQRRAMRALRDEEDTRRARDRRKRLVAGVADERESIHATTLSVPFAASVRRIGSVKTAATTRPKAKRRRRSSAAKTTRVARPPISDELRWQVLNRDRHTCRYCGSANGPWHMDHVIPVVMDGPTTFENLVTACSPCNLRKGANVWVPNPVS